MLYLMKLEWKKFKLYKYVKAVVISIVALIALNMLMLYASKQENELMFDSFKNAIMFFNVLIRAVFIIFASVILAKLTVEEYKTKTIQLMYSYPISRKKLMVGKLCIVYLFTVIAIIVSSLIIIPSLGVFNYKIQALPDNLTVELWLLSMPQIVIGALLSGFIALVPFYFGMRKKSTAATIISSSILACLLTSSVGGNAVSSYGIRLIVIGAASIITVWFTLKRKLGSVQEEEV